MYQIVNTQLLYSPISMLAPHWPKITQLFLTRKGLFELFLKTNNTKTRLSIDSELEYIVIYCI